jgi:hypothetical protein
MPNTLIQIKRASTVTIPILDAGEPAIDFDSGILYVGDGVTNPGLSFLSTSASLTPHTIDGASHTVTSSIIGGTLRIPTANNLEISRLGYYDLGLSTDVDYGAGVDVFDSRTHWINTEHVSTLSKGIFYTNAGTAVDMSHYPNTGAEVTGYSLKELSYANTSGVPKVLVTDVAGSGTLSFRQLTADDIADLTPSTSITSLTGASARSILRTEGSTTVGSLTYNYTSGTQPNKYLKTSKHATASTLSFGYLDYADLTGNFNLGGGATKNNWTLRYDTDTTSWVSSGILKVYSDTTSAIATDIPSPIVLDTTSCGITIDNVGTSGKTGRLTFTDYNSSNVVQSSLELVMINAINRRNPSTGSFLYNKFGPVLNVAAGRKHFAIAVSSDYLTQYPNMNFDEQGRISVWAPTTLNNPSTPYGIVDSGAGTEYWGFRFRDKTITYAVTSKTYSPEYSILRSDDLVVEYNNTNAINNTYKVYGIKFGDITLTGGSSPLKQEGRFMSFDTLTTQSNAYGLYINSINSEGTTSAKTTEGIYIGTIGNNSTIGGVGEACGLHMHTIQSDGDAYGIAIDNIISKTNITGFKLWGCDVNNTTDDADINRGIHLKQFSSSASTIAIDINTIGGKNSCGISLVTIASTDSGSSKRRAALYINNIDSTPFYTKITADTNYGIYALATKHYISGIIDLTGTAVNMLGNTTTYYDASTSSFYNIDSTQGSIILRDGNFEINGDITVDSGNINVNGDLVVQSDTELNNLIVNGTVTGNFPTTIGFCIVGQTAGSSASATYYNWNSSFSAGDVVVCYFTYTSAGSINYGVTFQTKNSGPQITSNIGAIYIKKSAGEGGGWGHISFTDAE